MSSIHEQRNRNHTTYRVLWRQDGRQQSLSFATLPFAERFKTLLDNHGPEEAIRVIESEEAHRSVPTVSEWMETYIGSLTGVQPATLSRYRTYLSRDVTPAFGQLPITAVTEHTIAKWVQEMTGSGKTAANKHGFVSAAFASAVKAGLINGNPCEGRRLPNTRVDEMVFLDPEEFQLLRSQIPLDRWKNLASWLVMTGMRFSEATALTPADIDVKRMTCRINKAWKYSTTRAGLQIGPPKTQKSRRTISLPEAALDVVDLTAPEYLFTNGVGSPVRAQQYYGDAWKPARDAARQAGLQKHPRVHDLRHTCASWMIAAGVPLPVIQGHLGHESIVTTIGTYGHLDRRSADTAAAAIQAAMNF